MSFRVLLLVLGDVSVFLILLIASVRAWRTAPALFGELVHDLHQLPPPLFVERGSGMRMRLPSLEG